MSVIREIHKYGLFNCSSICLPVNWLNDGKSKKTRRTERAVAIKEKASDSAKNWQINCTLEDPITLRSPTSLARFTDWAVAMFIKLMQAIKSIKMATLLNILTYSIRPLTGFPLTKLLRRYLSWYF